MTGQPFGKLCRQASGKPSRNNRWQTQGLRRTNANAMQRTYKCR
ncbi:hypothetical protein LOK49_LG12G02738 [Camellia lanceoleosa]|uniref:Uncharacterized protein n=1 Tax=Camellia lanceoleosa TaxID=1840588 RepID=A0ACC0FVT8_9ERIC|nr:hypothetical protein LOK49_LG12G02738 [Camellia lanceoleosa]